MRLLLGIHHVEQLARTRDIGGDFKFRAGVTVEDAPAAWHLHTLDRGLVIFIVVAGQHEIAVQPKQDPTRPSATSGFGLPPI